MTTFTVHAPGGDAVAAARADRLSFVPEKTSWGALVVPALWAPWHRMWWVLAGWVIATVAIDLVEGFVDARLAVVLSFAFLVWFGLSGNDLRRWSLERKGHRLVAVVEARDAAEAEARFLVGLADPARPRFGEVVTPPPAAPETPSPAPATAPSLDLPPVVGWAGATGVRP